MASLLLVACVSAVVAQASPVQGRPDFSGTWIMDLERSESPTQSSEMAGPVTIVITQTNRTVTVETTRGKLASRASYVFSATPVLPGTGAGAPVGRASFDGSTLVLEGTRVIRGQTVSTREARTLSDDGAEMTVDTLVLVQHGYEFRGAKNYGSAKDIFRRSVP
jgi:hypothetical protein